MYRFCVCMLLLFCVKHTNWALVVVMVVVVGGGGGLRGVRVGECF